MLLASVYKKTWEALAHVEIQWDFKHLPKVNREEMKEINDKTISYPEQKFPHSSLLFTSEKCVLQVFVFTASTAI